MQFLSLFRSEQHTGVTMAPFDFRNDGFQLLDGNHQFVGITRLFNGNIHIVALLVGVTGPVFAQLRQGILELHQPKQNLSIKKRVRQRFIVLVFYMLT